MRKSSIYPDRSQELLTLFEEAGNNSKLMCVPIDYAKKDHLVMFCNGNGEVLRKPFSVKNSSNGVKYLLDQVRRSCRHRHIQSEHVFFGGEKDDFSRREAAGQHADFGITRRFVRMAMGLMRTSQIYLPPDLRRSNVKTGQRADDYLSIWPYLRDKWSKAGAIDMAFNKDKPLGQWRCIVQEIYGIKLKT